MHRRFFQHKLQQTSSFLSSSATAVAAFAHRCVVSTTVAASSTSATTSQSSAPVKKARVRLAPVTAASAAAATAKSPSHLSSPTTLKSRMPQKIVTPVKPKVSTSFSSSSNSSTTTTTTTTTSTTAEKSSLSSTTQINEPDEHQLALWSIIEYIKLLVPTRGEDPGLPVTEVFASLTPEQRTLVRKHSKMLLKFLTAHPNDFALSPRGSMVCLVDPPVFLDEQQQHQQRYQRNSDEDNNKSSILASLSEAVKDEQYKLEARRQLALHQASVAEQRHGETLSVAAIVPTASVVIGSKNIDLTSSSSEVSSSSNQQSSSSLSSSSSAATTAAKLSGNLSEFEVDLLNKSMRQDYLHNYVPKSSVEEAIEQQKKEEVAAQLRAKHAETSGDFDAVAANSSSKFLKKKHSYEIVLDSIPSPDLVCIINDSEHLRAKAPLEMRSTDSFFTGNTTLSTQTLVKFVPTWFVPCSEVAARMGDGYTEEHIEHFFGDNAAVEVVTLEGLKFVRMHGGHRNKSLVDFDCADAENAEALFQHLKPDSRLVLDILKVCPPRGQWASLYDVVTRLPPEVQQRLPFQGPLSLLFFAQHQHIFSFTPNNSGGVSVPLSMPTHLSWDSSPFAKALHCFFTGLVGQSSLVGNLLPMALPKHSPTRRGLREELLRGLMLTRMVHGEPLRGVAEDFPFTCDVERDLDAQQVEDLMRVFVALHRDMFAYQEESSHFLQNQHNQNNNNQQQQEHHDQQQQPPPEFRTVRLRFELEAEERHQLDLPQQIEIARQRGDGKKIRKLKRRLAALQHPDNPLLDDERLAKTIAEFLPPDRSITWMRVKKNLPMELLDLVPPGIKKFLHKYPQHFKVYDVGVLTNFTLHLQLPHLPPPPGSFRQTGDYTEEELVSAVGQVLLRGPKTVATLSTYLPGPVQDTIRLKFGGVAQLVQARPENFALVIKDVRNRDLRTAVVTLLQVPNFTRLETNLVEAEQAAQLNKEMNDFSKSAEELVDDIDGGRGGGGGGGGGGARAGGTEAWDVAAEEVFGVKAAAAPEAAATTTDAISSDLGLRGDDSATEEKHDQKQSDPWTDGL